jgi:hypothetical protein
MDVVNQFSDGLKPVVEALTDHASTVTDAISSTLGEGVSAALKMIDSIPSLTLPFQIPQVDLTKLNIDLPKLPTIDFSHLVGIDPGDLSPEELTAKVSGDLKKLFSSISNIITPSQDKASA